jgi:zinc transport system ATP-binding protein
VVDDLTLEVAGGEVLAVLGANGSGKSTVVRALFGLAQLLGGSIDVFGEDRERFRAWHRLGYVPQANSLEGGVPTTVREIVSTGRLSRGRPWRRLVAADHAAVEAAIGSVRLDRSADLPVGTLSGGQQRRVLIARALATEPEVLVLDEPTAGVDASNQQALAQILEGLLAGGLTVVLVAHELGPVAPLITRVIVMSDGALAFDGTPGEVPASAVAHDPHHLHDPHDHHRAGLDIGLIGDR